MRRLLTVVGAIIAFLKPILWIINQMSNWSFLVSNVQAIGRFLATGWGTLASVVLGCLLIVFALRKEPARTNEPQRDARPPIGYAPVPQTPILDAPHEKLLRALWDEQRKQGKDMVFLTAHGVSTPTQMNITVNVLGVTVDEFQRLMRSMPEEYVRFFAWGEFTGVYCYSVKAAGQAYLRSLSP